jgi:hypothetical protein
MNAEVHIFYWFCIAGLLALSAMIEVRNNLDMYAEIEKVKLNILNTCLSEHRIDIALKDDDEMYSFECARYGHTVIGPIPEYAK